MAISAEVRAQLLERACVLTIGLGVKPTPVITLARACGLRVVLRDGAETDACGRLTFGSEPKIVVGRGGLAAPNIELADGDEDCLTERERFTVAHELGHWLAYRDFAVAPETQGGSGYWEDEKAINSFAAALLVPNAMLRFWLSRLDTSIAVVPGQLKQWTKDANASREVVARRVCEHSDEIGFATLDMVRSTRTGIVNLRVGFAAAGKNLALPAKNSHVRNRELLRYLRAKQLGRERLQNFSFVTAKTRIAPQTLEIAWTQVAHQEGNDAPDFVTSWRRLQPAAPSPLLN